MIVVEKIWIINAYNIVQNISVSVQYFHWYIINDGAAVQRCERKGFTILYSSEIGRSSEQPRSGYSCSVHFFYLAKGRLKRGLLDTCAWANLRVFKLWFTLHSETGPFFIHHLHNNFYQKELSIQKLLPRYQVWNKSRSVLTRRQSRYSLWKLLSKLPHQPYRTNLLEQKLTLHA